MKEIVIGFLLALCIGAMWNGMGSNSQPLGVNEGALQPGLAGQELVAEVDQGSFQGYVVDSKEPVLAEFYTSTCAPCKTMEPVLGKMALKSQGIMRICKINAETSQTLAETYNVKGTPAFVLFNDGQMTDSITGAMSESEMIAWLSRYDLRIPSSSSSSSSSKSSGSSSKTSPEG